ncbi:MAG: SDR family oxidoreductase [Planctomycetes bacterium]|nr:SDR family oxidoreductase [Planctomycetota bacterium]
MDLGLAGEVAVVIGGAQGIGLAIAQSFAAEGCRVAIVDRDAAVSQVGHDLQSASKVNCLGYVADIVHYRGLEQVAQQIITNFGRVDHVVVAAAIGSGKYGFPFWNLEPADWSRVLDVNVLGTVNSAHAFAPHLVKARNGTMLFIASVAAQIGSQTDPPYSASKAAVINFAQCAAKDLAPHNVRVNVISPGMIKTDLNRSVWQAWNAQQPTEQQRTYEEWADEKVRRIAPLGRWQEPGDIANAAVFLASRRAANITGQTVNVDGGQVMHS